MRWPVVGVTLPQQDADPEPDLLGHDSAQQNDPVRSATALAYPADGPSGEFFIVAPRVHVQGRVNAGQAPPFPQAGAHCPVDADARGIRDGQIEVS